MFTAILSSKEYVSVMYSHPHLTGWSAAGI